MKKNMKVLLCMLLVVSTLCSSGIFAFAESAPCTVTGKHAKQLKSESGKYYQYCTGCDYMKECSYTIPVLENADKVCYWSFSG